MIILGLSGAVGHDASAAILVDGKLIAAAEEERFLRDKHAKTNFPTKPRNTA
jgi:Predicted carbamoyl transferase, NodU family